MKVSPIPTDGVLLCVSAGEFGGLQKLIDYMLLLPERVHGLVAMKLSQDILRMARPTNADHKLNVSFWKTCVKTKTPVYLDNPIFNIGKTCWNWASESFIHEQIRGITVRGDITSDQMIECCLTVARKLKDNPVNIFFNPKTTDRDATDSEVESSILKVHRAYEKIKKYGQNEGLEEEYSIFRKNFIQLGLLLPSDAVKEWQDIFPDLTWMVAGWRPPGENSHEHVRISYKSAGLKGTLIVTGRPIAEPHGNKNASTEERVEQTLKILESIGIIKP